MNPDQYETLASSCPDGDCPTIFRHRESGRIRVRGANPDQRPGEPAELDIDFEPAVWSDLIAQLQ